MPTAMSPSTGVGRGAKDSGHEAKDLEIQQLKSMLKANNDEINMLKQIACEADEQHMHHEDVLDKALQEADWMRPELARKTDLLLKMSRRNKSMSKQLGKTNCQMDGQRIKKVELTKALNDKEAKLARLQKSMARLGRNDEQPMDDKIARGFSNLKSDIMQLVRLFFSSCDSVMSFDGEEAEADEEGEGQEGDDEELEELQVRHWVARELHQQFFDLDALFNILGTSVEGGRCLSSGSGREDAPVSDWIDP